MVLHIIKEVLNIYADSILVTYNVCNTKATYPIDTMQCNLFCMNIKWEYTLTKLERKLVTMLAKLAHMADRLVYIYISNLSEVDYLVYPMVLLPLTLDNIDLDICKALR